MGGADVPGVQTCALPMWARDREPHHGAARERDAQRLRVAACACGLGGPDVRPRGRVHAEQPGEDRAAGPRRVGHAGPPADRPRQQARDDRDERHQRAVLTSQERHCAAADEGGDVAHRWRAFRGTADRGVDEPGHREAQQPGSDAGEGKHPGDGHVTPSRTHCVPGSTIGGRSAATCWCCWGVNGASTYWAQSPTPSGSGPTRIRNRAYWRDWSAASMLLRPLCPPADPSARRRKVPQGSWKSSTSTSSSVAGLKDGSARSDASAAPLRFMDVVGLSTRTGTLSTDAAVIRARSPRRNGGSPQRATLASASQKPALWRVAAYSGPGLPRPTTARRDQLSLPPLGFSAFSGLSPFSLFSLLSPLAGAAPAPPLASGFAAAPPSAASPSSSSPSRTLRISSGSATSIAASGVGAATSSARGGTTVAIVSSASVRILALGMLRSRTCNESPIWSAVTSSSTRSGMFSGSTSISTSRVTWSSTPPALRTPSGFPTRCTGTLSLTFSVAWSS